MPEDQELIDGIDGDALPERLYNVKGSQTCKKCGRPLKGKIAYLTLENDLICRDTGTESTAIEALLCGFFVTVKGTLKRHGHKLPKSALKRIEKIIKDSIE